jgi:thioredoxin-related protein
MAKEKLKKVVIYINTVNESFRPEPMAELARTLRELADKIENGRFPKFVFDVNGNKIGSVETF